MKVKSSVKAIASKGDQIVKRKGKAMKFSIKKINNSFWFSVIYKGVNVITGIVSSRKEALNIIFQTIKLEVL